MSQPKVTVLAGSARFTASLAEPITRRTGERPRVVADPGQAFALCRGSAGLLVLEFDPRWTKVLRDLGGAASRLRVVAAVSPAVSEAAAPLGDLGVRSVPWTGDPAAVVGAIEATAAQAEAPLAPAAAAAAPAAFFGDVGTASALPAPGPNGATAPAPAGAPPAWPAGVSSDYEAEQVLCAALAGLKAAGDPALDATLAVLTEVERQALAGDPALADPGPFRGAAALRYRVSSALASAPAPGTPVDAAAGGALLAEIDAVLTRLKGAAEGGESLDAIRKALVHEAVDLSEALHRLQPAGSAAAPVPATPAARATAVVTARVLSNEAHRAQASARRWPLWGAFAAALLAASGYHLRHHLARVEVQPPFAGAPGGTAGIDQGGTKVLSALPGKPLDPVQIQQFRALEEAKGNHVEEMAPGVWVVRPAAAQRGQRGGTP